METREALSTVTIDFSEASIEWNRNKRKMGNGMYRYICVGFFRNGKSCNRNPLPFTNTCQIHDTALSNNSISSIKTHTSSFTNIKINPEVCSEVSESDEISHISTNLKRKFKYVNIFKYLINTICKSSKTLPLTDSINEETKEPERRMPHINARAETITIYTTPCITGTFKQIRNAISKYRSIDCVDCLQKINDKRYDVSVVMHHLNLILSFLEGLCEFTKLDMKQQNIIDLKSDILLFFGYDVSIYLNTTSTKWANTSADIRSEITNIMGIIFNELPYTE